LIAFNWNYLVADWRLESPFYIGHVTKIVAVLLALTYVVIRGMMLPLKRGITIKQLLPIRFLVVTFICFLADAVKILMFSIPKRKHEFSALDHKS
jgi:hypothetical protein